MAITLNTYQQTLVDSTTKKATWLFYVIDTNEVVYEWSTKTESVILGSDWDDPTTITWDADWIDETTYTFKILSFSGITMNRPKSEYSIISPSDVTFGVSNIGHALDPADFVGGKVWISLYLDNGTVEGVVRRWRFKIKSADPGPHEFTCNCEDFFQEILKGDYPNTRYAREVFPTATLDNNSDVKVPLPFGVCYVPLKYCVISEAVSVTATVTFVASSAGARCSITGAGFGNIATGIFCTITGAVNAENNGTFLVYPNSTATTLYFIESAGFVAETVEAVIKQNRGMFLLGKSDKTYTVSKLRSPRDVGPFLEWTTGLNQYDITDADAQEWTLLEPLIYDLDGDGTDDSPGVVKATGESVEDHPVQFSRSDTSSMTNPADIIKFVLKDMGAADDDINDDSFTTAAAIFTGWGLEFNGAFWYNQTREESLSKLLNMCHASLFIDEQINIFVQTVASQATMTDTEVLKMNDIDSGTFSYSTILKDTINDGGYLSAVESGLAQDKFNIYKVPAKATTNNLSDETLEIPFVQNSQHVQKLGSLYYQRKLLEKANISFLTKATELALIPDQFITIDQDIFGGTYTALVDSITINEDISMQFQCILFSDTMDDWGDLAFDPIVPTAEPGSKFFEPAISGPASSKRVATSSFEVWGNPYLVVGPNDLRAPYTSIQTALNALVDSNHSGIYILDGDYQLTQPVYMIDRNIDIIGESQNVVIKNAVGQSGFVFHNLTKTYNFKNFTLDSQNVSDASFMIYLYGDTSAENASKAYFDKIVFNLFDDGVAGGSGTGDFGIYSTNGVGVIDVLRCFFTGGVFGVRGRTDNIKIDNCDFDGQTYYTISSYTAAGDIAICSNNRLKNVYYGGIFFDATAIAPVIANNTVSAISTSSIYTSFIGIYSSSDNVKIAQNTILFDNDTENTSVTGISVGSVNISNLPSVIGNTIDFALDSTSIPYGIRALCCTDGVFTDNIIKINNQQSPVVNPRYGIYVYGSGATKSLRNKISNNGIDMVRNGASDIGILMTSLADDNTGTGNTTYRVGTSISDAGANNTVVASDT